MIRRGFLDATRSDHSGMGPLRDSRNSENSPGNWGRITNSARGSSWGASGGNDSPARTSSWPRSNGWGSVSSPTAGSCTDASKRDDISSVPTIFLPPNLAVPMNALTCWYSKHHDGTSVQKEDCYSAWSGGTNQKKLFTAVFRCPLTHEIWASGRWCAHGAPDKGNAFVVAEEENDKGETVEVMWYTKKKFAEHAAAARALDCLSLRTLQESYNLCSDAPYMSKDDSPSFPTIQEPLPEVDDPLTLTVAGMGGDPMDEDPSEEELNEIRFKDKYRSMRTEGRLATIASDTAPQNSEETVTVENHVRGQKRGRAEEKQKVELKNLPPPTALLVKWYQERYKGIMITDDYFHFWNDGRLDHQKRFTAIFRCPVKHEIWASGRWVHGRGVPNKPGNRFVAKAEQRDDGSMVEVVWYTTKKNAKHAVAARMMDCISHREQHQSYGLCADEPYLVTDAPSLPPIGGSLLSPWQEWLEMDCRYV